MLPIGFAPVSYTHLDVYKRQLFLRLVEREEHGQSEFHELGVEQ